MGDVMGDAAFDAMEAMFPYEDEQGRRFNVLHPSDWQQMKWNGSEWVPIEQGRPTDG